MFLNAVLRRHFSISAKLSSIDIGGVFPPIVTPFDANEEVDWKNLSSNALKLSSTTLPGLVVQGSNGEFAFMTTNERVEVVKQVKKSMQSNKILIAGTGCESTKATMELTKKMADAGADAALVITPCFYKSSMSNDALYRHFSRVADNSPIPIILYSVPANTGIDLPVSVIVKLSSHRNVIGLKDSGGNIVKLAEVVHQTFMNDFKVLAGSASFLYPAMNVGCVGGICALANVLPSEVCELYSLSKQGEAEKAMHLQGCLVQPNQGVTALYGISGLKQAMPWFGFNGGIARPPILPLNKEQTHNLRNIFVSNGFLSD